MNSALTENLNKEQIQMKKLWAVLAALIFVVCLFTACKGADGGKVTDTTDGLSALSTTDPDGIVTDGESLTSQTDAGTAASSGDDRASSDESVTM